MKHEKHNSTSRSSTMVIKVLHTFCGIGGCRKDWPTNIQVTAVEFNEEAAAIYKELFPQDEVIVADAYEYIRLHWNEYDFIWASPSCQSHSKMRFLSSKAGSYDAVLPDPRLWSTIIFLKHFCRNRDIHYCVENVDMYYRKDLDETISEFFQPFLTPTIKLGRHLFWTNFPLEKRTFDNHGSHNARGSNTKGDFFDLTRFKPKTIRKDQLLRTCSVWLCSVWLCSFFELCFSYIFSDVFFTLYRKQGEPGDRRARVQPILGTC